jgi:hypothetical protein
MTPENARWTRRYVLVTGAALAAAATCGAAEAAPGAGAGPGTWPRAHARAVLASLGLLTAAAIEHARHIDSGRGAAPADLAALVRDTAADAGLTVESLLLEAPTALRRSLQASIRRDFHAGRTVMLDGWILARSEARIYTVAALL